MSLATEPWNIQLFNHNSDNITLELAEDQLANKKQQQNKTNNTASQHLGPQQLRQAHLQLPQLSRQHAATAISRQLSKNPLPATGSQTAAWQAATLTASFRLSKKELSVQHLSTRSFYNNPLVDQELVQNKLQNTDASSIWVVEQNLAPTIALHSKASLRLSSCSSLMTTRALPNLALSFENLTFSNFSSNSLGSGTLSQLSAAILEKNFGQQLAESELQQNFSQDQQQLQDSQLAQKNVQQLNLAQHSFTEKTLHNKLATNFWNKAFQKNFLASKEVAEKNFQDKQLVDSSFTKTAQGAFKEELLTACSPEASDTKQLFSTSLGQQSAAKTASHRELLPACFPGTPGEQELLQ